MINNMEITIFVQQIVWVYLQKEHFKEKDKNLKPLNYGPYKSIRQNEENVFRLAAFPSCIGIHSVSHKIPI